MNHDYAHCSDYEENNARCPKSCFRAELTRDLLLNPQPRSSWMHFAGTDECPLKSFAKYRETVSRMKIEIKPCPFCGGEASVVQYVGDLYAVVCNYCFVRTSKYSEKEKAVSAWNRRDGENHDT